MGTDFFDDDLLDTTNLAGRDDLRSKASRTAESGRLQRQKEEITDQVAGAVHEMERLRIRQAELEREKAALEDLKRRQETYERGKRGLILKLEQALVRLQQQEAEAARTVDALVLTEKSFTEILGALQSVNEETWGESQFEEELSRALGLVEEAEDQYRKGLSRVQAATGFQPEVAPEPEAAAPSPADTFKQFSFWLKAGFAFSLPLAAVLVILFIVQALLRGHY